MKKNLLLLAAAFSCCTLFAEKTVVRQYNYAGPYPVHTPFLADSLNVHGKKFTGKELLNTPLSFRLVRENARTLEAAAGDKLPLPAVADGAALNLVSFYLNSDRFVKGKLSIEGLKNYEVYLDDRMQKPAAGKLALTLEPRRYEIVIKYLAEAGVNDSLLVAFEADTDAEITPTVDPEKRYTLSEVFDGKRIRGASLSPDGRRLIVAFQKTFPGGDRKNYAQVIERSTGRVVMEADGDAARMQWMPCSNRIYYTRRGTDGKELIALDPGNQTETVLATKLPDGSFTFAPTEDFLLFSIRENGPEKQSDMLEILTPDDRQPGWRNRTFLHRYDLATGLLQRLTYGHTSTYLNDISRDGRYIVFTCNEPVLTERPFTRTSLYRMDLQTFRTDTLLQKAKFIGSALFSPDGHRLLIEGSGDAFDGIGLKIASGQISNLSDGQVFLYDPVEKKATALTKDFDPSVDRAIWSPSDGSIYLQAKDKDCVRLYTVNPATGTIRPVPVREDVVSGFETAAAAPALVYFGESISNSQRLYTCDLKKGKTTCLLDLSEEVLKDVVLGKADDWNFVSAAGDTIYGRYYLPPHFDPTRKYPMIVNYYGGTTPTARVLESRYPSHVYAALGYVVYIVQPSGATGFGQEFSARHVNAWGKRTADEIIEGTQLFCRTHPFVDAAKIGCIGASYGGFMTQFLQTKTDLFAAAVSHAGISDITSYWGEGYWGYSYSELASAGSYPWNAPDMYTKQSPLFNADKIRTPILFLHGTADTNVPVGESIQMFTALKLLGRPTAFIEVKGENHQIMDYSKRLQWNRSIYAWFAKWLKDQPEWWDALYPPKNL